MPQNYVVPNIYSDMSDQSQGYFAFRFTCHHCYWQIDTQPIRSKVATASNIMDLGVGMLNGFWGRAAEMGEKMYGSKWHKEQADALQKAWAEVKQNFHFCPKCSSTVCTRCFNTQLTLCVSCAPDLKADAAQFQHGLNVEAQREQIEKNYHAPQFNTSAVPSAVTPDMIMPPQQPSHPSLSSPANQPQQLAAPMGQNMLAPQAPSAAAIAGFQTPGYPDTVPCPNCRRLGAPGKFCQDCGTKLPLPDLFCPNCSAQILNNARFCQECGTKVQSIKG